MWASCGVYIGWTVITGSMFESRKGARASLGRTAIALSSWVMFTNRREICRLRQVDDVPTPNQDTWRFDIQIPFTEFNQILLRKGNRGSYPPGNHFQYPRCTSSLFPQFVFLVLEMTRGFP